MSSVFSSPKIPDPPDPARRPERREGVDPDDIVVGGQDDAEESGRRGRRALRRPSGGGDGVGTGLSV